MTPRVHKKLRQVELCNPSNMFGRPVTESVASILGRESNITIQKWLDNVEESAELMCIPLSRKDRAAHLPKLLRNIIFRLRLESGLTGTISRAAREHGEVRLRQGYTAAMLIEESRIWQVNIFSTLQRNLCCVDFHKVLSDIVIIADECESQLKQALLCYDAKMDMISRLSSPLI
jgi:hypothetical protein